MADAPNGEPAATPAATPTLTLDQRRAVVDALKEKMKLLDERKERLLKGRPSVRLGPARGAARALSPHSLSGDAQGLMREQVGISPNAVLRMLQLSVG